MLIEKNYLYGWGYQLGRNPDWPKPSFKWWLRTPEDGEIALAMLGQTLDGETVGMVEICEGPYLKERIKLDSFELRKQEDSDA